MEERASVGVMEKGEGGGGEKRRKLWVRHVVC